MTKTLIIPDLHHRWELAEKIIANVPHDSVVFIGDYFDNFTDDPDEVRETANWLVESVQYPNRIHLWGNHDMHYGFPYPLFQCSGYEQWKFFMIENIVENDTWGKLKWCHNLDNKFLITHAGLHKSYLPKNIEEYNGSCFLEKIESFLNKEAERGLIAMSRKNLGIPWIFTAGRSSGGIANVGGIVWCRLPKEFYPISGIHQIFGHTHQDYPVFCVYNNNQVKYQNAQFWKPDSFLDTNISINLCMDSAEILNYAVWNGTTLEVSSISY